MNKVLFSFLLFCCMTHTNAQPGWSLKENNNWKFYEFSGLSFLNNAPVPDSSALGLIYSPGGEALSIGAYGNASVSDPQGNLLFYTNAFMVWDRNHQPMPNGTGLIPGNSIDATLILPVLNNPNQYYIFYTSGANNFGQTTTDAFLLHYSIVDMTLNNGMGDVVANQKNVLVDANLSGQLKAVPGNDCNLWLVSHDMDSTRFKVYEVNTNGVNNTPVISDVGHVHYGTYGALTFWGHLNISHNRDKIAFMQVGGEGTAVLELFDFDASTGIVSNATVIDTTGLQYHSVCFSPNDTKLYTTDVNPFSASPLNVAMLFQYDLTAGTADAIMDSKTVLSDSISSYNPTIRIGADGKMYVPSSYRINPISGSGGFYSSWMTPADYPNIPDYPFNAYLGCIQDPEQPGISCNYKRLAVALKPLASAAECLGGEYERPIPADTIFSKHDTVMCTSSLVLNAGAGYYSYVWDDGNIEQHRVINDTGTYWVHCFSFCHFKIDTFVVRPAINPDLGNDTFLCPGDVIQLEIRNILSPTATWQWNNGSEDNSIVVKDTGTYWVKVTDDACVNIDSIKVGRQSFCNCVVDIPNAFSPNNDGLNDVFIPVVDENCPLDNFSLDIYNRWGQRVFHSSNAHLGWNGRQNNEPADVGVYNFILHFESGIKRKPYHLKGNITLIR